MCDDHPDVDDGPNAENSSALGPSRRSILLGAALGGTAAVTGVWPTYADAEPFLTKTPRIRPRSQWAGSGSPVRGPLQVERAGDVKVLLEHHSASSNSYTAAAVPGILRSFYRLHVDKGWPDLAYNFLVDRHGGIWEGRAGSATRPVVPSATGGTQGFSQIVCWIGDHRSTAPTTAAQQSMISMLAWLARKYAVRTDPGSTTSFVSRGSSRFPRGSTVRTRTIEGHRKMSSTVCPGDAAYTIVRDRSQAEVTRLNRS
ncbi:MAG TPA: N-acetylmuramoyl-L-alanine amidase [Mycobacteriales bacterium]|nr:N-acetylmuramoyl-L-alanine amidase [Mycobacteriales bacterium]